MRPGGAQARDGNVHYAINATMQLGLWVFHAAITTLFMWAIVSSDSPASSGTATKDHVRTLSTVIALWLAALFFFGWGPIGVLWTPINAYGLFRKRRWALTSTLVYLGFLALHVHRDAFRRLRRRQPVAAPKKSCDFDRLTASSWVVGGFSHEASVFIVPVLSFALVACGKDISVERDHHQRVRFVDRRGRARQAHHEDGGSRAPAAHRHDACTPRRWASRFGHPSMDNLNKSVSVSYEAVSATGINVSEPSGEVAFDELKKENKGDKIMFPFKRWVKEGPTTAVEEFTNEAQAPGFLAISWKQVGGKTYVCKSNGLSGLKNAEDADTVLKTCDTLAAK